MYCSEDKLVQEPKEAPQQIIKASYRCATEKNLFEHTNRKKWLFEKKNKSSILKSQLY